LGATLEEEVPTRSLQVDQPVHKCRILLSLELIRNLGRVLGAKSPVLVMVQMLPGRSILVIRQDRGKIGGRVTHLTLSAPTARRPHRGWNPNVGIGKEINTRGILEGEVGDEPTCPPKRDAK